ncbi:Monoterpene epsilon-lactone hydrolase [compost metagenome]
MNRTSIEQLEAIKNYLRQTNTYENKSVEQIRQEMSVNAALFPKPSDVHIQQAAIEHLKAEWITPVNLDPDHDNKLILYFHGGGFIAGTSEFYRDLCTRIAKTSGVKVLIVEYRLAPEHPYPAANEDCLTSYRWLLQNGYSAPNIVFGGDSVGASLVLMTMISLRDYAEELPAGAFLLSPHTDLVHLDGESYSSRAGLDPTGSLKGNKKILEAYLGDNKKTSDMAILSPLRRNLDGLPHLFIQVGDHEVLLSDSLRLEEKAKSAGVEVTREVWENMWSVFQMLAYMLPEANHAIANIGQFVRAKFN